MATDPVRLKVQFDSATQSVSALSSLLRAMQAGLRTAARGTSQGIEPFSEKREPILMVSASGGVHTNAPLELAFSFADAATRRPIDSLSQAGFDAFLDALEGMLKSQPRRTLWGEPAGMPAGDPAAGQATELDIRAARIWAELGRLSTVSLALGGRRIRMSEGSIQIGSS